MRYQAVYSDSHIPTDYINLWHTKQPTKRQLSRTQAHRYIMRANPDLLTNHLSSDSILTIKLRLWNKRLYSERALVDSGANLSFISKETMRKLSLAGGLSRSRVHDFHRRYIGATGTEGIISDCFLTGIYLSDSHYAVIKLHVVESDSFEILLGRDFLLKTRAVLDLNKAELRTFQYELNLDNSMIVKSGESIKCRARVSNEIIPDGTLLQVRHKEIIPGLSTKEAISVSKNNCMCIELYNNNGATYCLTENYHIATAETIPLSNKNQTIESKLPTTKRPQFTIRHQHQGKLRDNDLIGGSSSRKPCRVRHLAVEAKGHQSELYSASSRKNSSAPTVTRHCHRVTDKDKPVIITTDQQRQSVADPTTNNETEPPKTVNWGDSREGDIDVSQREELVQMLNNHKNAFVNSDGKIGKCDIAPLKIKLKPDAKPVKKTQYRLSPKLVQAVDDQIQNYIDQGILEACDSEWNSPVLILAKGVKASQKHLQDEKSKEKRYRFVCDLRAVNDQIVNDTFVIPNIEDLLDSICSKYEDEDMKPRFFSSLDLKDAYFQCTLDAESRDYTAFRWRNMQLRFCRVPMGLSSSGGKFCKLINKILGDQLQTCVIAYLDDILVYSPNYEQHMKDLESILKAFEKANLKLSPTKCKFARSSAEFLGFKFDAEGYAPNQRHTEALSTYPRPKTVRQLRTFLGLVNFFRKFLRDRAGIAAPLFALTKKNAIFKWSEECENSFEQLKHMLTSEPTLAYPRFQTDFHLFCDASTNSIGATLIQLDENGNHKPVAYCGRSLTRHERNYSVTRLELLAVVYSVQYFRTYLEHRKFFVYTDHSAVTNLLTTKTLTPQMARYALILQSFDFEIRHQRGKDNEAADSLSRREYNTDHTEIDDYIDRFPEDQGERAMDEDKGIIATHDELTARVCHRIETMRKQNTSALQRNSLLGQEDLTESFNILYALENPSTDKPVNKDNVGEPSKTNKNNKNRLKKGKLNKATRKKNDKAADIDELERDIHMLHQPYNLRPRGGDMRFLNHDSVIDALQDSDIENTNNRQDTANSMDKSRKNEVVGIKVVIKEQTNDPIYGALMNYLTDKVLPKDNEIMRQVIAMEPHYLYHEGALYRKPGSNRCQELRNHRLVIPGTLVQKILERVHGNDTSVHHGVNKTIFNTKKHYYWVNMERDIRVYVGTCHHCLTKKHGQRREKPPLQKWQQMERPFEFVFVDIAGALPLTKARFQYICVLVDAFSRYVIAFPMRTKSKGEFFQGIYKNLICVHGLIDHLHSDRGGENCNLMFKQLCTKFNIEHHINSGYSSASNGRAERYIKSITEILRTMVNDKGSDWDILLPHVIFHLNCAVNTAHNHSPYYLLHGRTPKTLDMIPGTADLEESDMDFVSQMKRNQHDAYELTKNVCDIKGEKMKRYYDLHTKKHNVKVGSIVYLYRPVKAAETSFKLSQHYVGPYTVIELLARDKVRIIDSQSRKEYQVPIHVSRLKLASQLEDNN